MAKAIRWFQLSWWLRAAVNKESWCLAVETVCQGHGKEQGAGSGVEMVWEPQLCISLLGQVVWTACPHADGKGRYWRYLGHKKHSFGESSRAEVRSSPSTTVNNCCVLHHPPVCHASGADEPQETLEKASEEKHPFLPQELSHVPSISLQWTQGQGLSSSQQSSQKTKTIPKGDNWRATWHEHWAIQCQITIAWAWTNLFKGWDLCKILSQKREHTSGFYNKPCPYCFHTASAALFYVHLVGAKYPTAFCVTVWKQTA